MQPVGSPQILDPDAYSASWKSRWFEYRDFLRGRLHRKFKPDVAILREFIPPQSLVIDAGSNHGRFAIELADLYAADNHCSVLAFEPVDYNLRVQRKVLGKRKNVTAFPYGLSDTEAEFEVLIPLKENGALRHGGAFIANAEQIESRLDGRNKGVYVKQRIRCKPLDQVEEVRSGTVAFIKIDVEGHELRVLQGAQEILHRDHPTILMESRGELKPLQLLANLGFKFFDLDLRENGSWTDLPGTVRAEIVKSAKHHDVLCWHPGKLSTRKAPGFATSFARTRYGT